MRVDRRPGAPPAPAPTPARLPPFVIFFRAAATARAVTGDGGAATAAIPATATTGEHSQAEGDAQPWTHTGAA